MNHKSQLINAYKIYNSYNKRIEMQTAKDSFEFRHENYEVKIVQFSEKKLELTVIDFFQKLQFQQKLLTLTHIGTTTLLKALQGKMKQIKIGMKVVKTAQTAVLQIDVLVASPFLKPVEEMIYLKKIRDVSDSELLQSAVSQLGSKIKNLKESTENRSNKIYSGTVQTQQKSYNQQSIYDPIASIKLPKGEFILTISFLVKATNSWMYLYFQQGQQVIQNCGFYVPSGHNYIPLIIKKKYTVSNNDENVTFTTYSAQSYPIILKNVVLTAQKL